MSDTLALAPLARIRRGLVGMLEINGRATRVDFFFACIVLSLAASAVDWVAERLSQGPRVPYEGLGSHAVFLLIMASLVRRLHDQDRSGWYSLIAVPVLVMGAYGQYLFNIGELPLPRLGAPYNAINILLVIVLWGLALWPGTSGINRYGPDPRDLRPKRP